MEDWLNLAPENLIAHVTFKICWVTCVKPKLECLTLHTWEPIESELVVVV